MTTFAKPMTLRPCPFCGSQNLSLRPWVKCDDCNSEGPFIEDAETTVDFIRLWNSRWEKPVEECRKAMEDVEAGRVHDIKDVIADLESTEETIP